MSDSVCVDCRTPVARRFGQCRDCGTLRNRRMCVQALADLILHEPGLKRAELAERLCISERALQDHLAWAHDPLYAPAVRLHYTGRLVRARGYRWLPGELERAMLDGWPTSGRVDEAQAARAAG